MQIYCKCQNLSRIEQKGINNIYVNKLICSLIKLLMLFKKLPDVIIDLK